MIERVRSCAGGPGGLAILLSIFAAAGSCTFGRPGGAYPGGDAESVLDGEIPHGDGGPDSALDAGPGADGEMPTCGNGICEPEEHCTSCPADCCLCPTADTLVDESIVSLAECSAVVTSGEFNGSGWRPTDYDSHLVYDLGGPVDCGAMWLELRNFDPMTEYVHVTGEDRYLNFLALYQGDHGDHWTAATNHEASLAVQATDEEPDSFRDHSLKLKAGTGTEDGWGGGGATYTSTEYPWDTGHGYRLCLDWNAERVRLFVDDAEETAIALTWSTEGASSPALRYLFIGRTLAYVGGWLDGVVFANVRVVAGGTCP